LASQLALLPPAPRADRPLRVGIVWAGQPKHQNDRNRSLSLATLRPLFEVPGITWISLQKGDGAEAQLEPMNAELRDAGLAPITALGPAFRDFVDTAHAIQALDVVLTVDTGVAHLAGAMGVPTFVMLPFVPDWRWQIARTDSPWYPDVRLFRQSQKGVWDAPVQALISALTDLVAAR
jgi:hypothetical protein